MAAADLPDLLARSSRVVAGVATGRSLAEVLPARAREPAVVDITHGTLRRYGRVQEQLRALSRTGKAPAEVEALLWCAFYAADSGRYSDYTLVDCAVRACGALDVMHARGFVNAVLRRFLRERETIEAGLANSLEAVHWHPAWWIEALQSAWPDDWRACLEAGNRPAAMCLRVNRRRIDRDRYLARLVSAGIQGRCVDEDGILLEYTIPVVQLPGFSDGEVSVQDRSAQRAAVLLDLEPGQRVLDACAAPGGKAMHILERADVELTALDADAARCERIRENLARLGLRAGVRTADCERIARELPNCLFDRILLDAPCTASGVVARHPDIKWLRRSGDAAGFAARQSRMLDALWPSLCTGGKLLYATCSVFPEENEHVVDAFLGRTRDAERLPQPWPAQILPVPGRDGFHYALLLKRI